MKRQVRYMKANEAVHSAKRPEPFTKEWSNADLIRRAELAKQEMEQAILRVDVEMREARQDEREEKETKSSNSLFLIMMFGIIILIGAGSTFK